MSYEMRPRAFRRMHRELALGGFLRCFPHRNRAQEKGVIGVGKDLAHRRRKFWPIPDQPQEYMGIEQQSHRGYSVLDFPSGCSGSLGLISYQSASSSSLMGSKKFGADVSHAFGESDRPPRLGRRGTLDRMQLGDRLVAPRDHYGLALFNQSQVHR